MKYVFQTFSLFVVAVFIPLNAVNRLSLALTDKLSSTSDE